jgi:hypothetical protein
MGLTDKIADLSDRISARRNKLRAAAYGDANKAPQTETFKDLEKRIVSNRIKESKLKIAGLHTEVSNFGHPAQ